MPKRITIDTLKNELIKLPLQDVLKLINEYSSANETDMEQAKINLVRNDIEKHLLSAGVNKTCPYCNSKMISANGSNQGTKRYKCCQCKKSFTLFTGTLMEKTRYSWDIWVKVVEMILNNIPLTTMRQVLIDDYNLLGLDYKTVSAWRHKLLHAMAKMEMPILTGVIQIDETYFREDQKGSRNLVSTIPEVVDRKPRKGRIPSIKGVMGNEFANVVCMIDDRGYAVAKVVGLGKLDFETFKNEFETYINQPSFLCTDANPIYKEYSDNTLIPLYIKPSTYDRVISDAIKAASEKKSVFSEENIIVNLYNKGQLDYIYSRRKMPYREFIAYKHEKGLSLGRVNQLHSEIKLHIEKETHGVTTKFLPDYIQSFIYLWNWKVKNGHPASSKKDAESILIELLKSKTNMKYKDMDSAKIISKKNSAKYERLLTQKTEQAKEITKNQYFKFTEEDGVVTFSLRNFLEQLNKTELNRLRRKYRIDKNYTRRSVINELMRMPTISDDIIEIINSKKLVKIQQEDIDAQPYAEKLLRTGMVSKK